MFVARTKVPCSAEQPLGVAGTHRAGRAPSCNDTTIMAYSIYALWYVLFEYVYYLVVQLYTTRYSCMNYSLETTHSHSPGDYTLQLSCTLWASSRITLAQYLTLKVVRLNPHTKV
jgi:hypothetical protein